MDIQNSPYQWPKIYQVPLNMFFSPRKKWRRFFHWWIWGPPCRVIIPKTIWGFPKMVVSPINTPKWSFLVGKPTILGNTHMKTHEFPHRKIPPKLSLDISPTLKVPSIAACYATMKGWRVVGGWSLSMLCPTAIPHENSMKFSLVLYKDPLYIAKYLDLLDM